MVRQFRKESAIKYGYSFSNLAENALNKFERKNIEKGVVRDAEGFTWFILHEDRNDVIKILKSWKDSFVSIHGITEKVKHKTKKIRSPIS